MNAQMTGRTVDMFNSNSYLHTQKGKSKNLRPRFDGGGGMKNMSQKTMPS